MIRHGWLFGLTMAVAGTLPAQPRVDIAAIGKDFAGPRTEVLVLGSAHLSGAPKDFKPESLAPVLDRLAAFKPDIITVEQIPGEGCDLLARHPTVYAPESTKTYCRDTAAARAATGLDVPAAIAAADRALVNWPASPTPAQRRHLAALFLAANDMPSAFVQWLHLLESERRAGDGLDDALVADLAKRMQSNNETYGIGARLAARLGLQRLYSIDDHTGDNVVVADEAAYGKAIQAAWQGAAAKLDPIRARQDELMKSGDMLALYRYVNSPEMLRVAIEGDFGSALREPSSQRYGRQYVAGWETRNLRMVANIHAAFRESPGARVLSIVGSSHKPWFDDLLGRMQGVEIVDAESVLK